MENLKIENKQDSCNVHERLCEDQELLSLRKHKNRIISFAMPSIIVNTKTKWS